MTVATTPPPARRPLACQDCAISAMIWSPSTIVAVLVDDDHAVGVAVERDADIGAQLLHLLAQGLGMRRAALVVDVEAVRLVVDGDDLGAQLPQRVGRHLVGGAVGAIDHDAQAASDMERGSVRLANSM